MFRCDATVELFWIKEVLSAPNMCNKELQALTPRSIGTQRDKNRNELRNIITCN